MLQRILNINTRHMKPSHTWDKNLRACNLCSLNFQEREQWQGKTNLNDEPFSMTKNCQNMNLDASTLFPCYNLISTFASNVLSMKLVIWYVILIRTYYLYKTICDLYCDPDMAIIFAVKGSRLVSEDGLACNLHRTRCHISWSFSTDVSVFLAWFWSRNLG